MGAQNAVGAWQTLCRFGSRLNYCRRSCEQPKPTTGPCRRGYDERLSTNHVPAENHSATAVCKDAGRHDILGQAPTTRTSTLIDSRRVSSYVDMVTDARLLEDATTSDDPAVGLRAVRALKRLYERLEAIQVTSAREQGWSWQAIADALGVSRQAVHQKYQRRR